MGDGIFGRGLENRGIWPSIDDHVILSARLASVMRRVVAGWVKEVGGLGEVGVLRVGRVEVLVLVMGDGGVGGVGVLRIG